jgi:hypothetical protein
MNGGIGQVVYQDEDRIVGAADVDTGVVAEGVNLDETLHVVNVDSAGAELEVFDGPSRLNLGLRMKRPQNAEENLVLVCSG